jgi:hypothetical protein
MDIYLKLYKYSELYKGPWFIVSNKFILKNLNNGRYGSSF